MIRINNESQQPPAQPLGPTPQTKEDLGLCLQRENKGAALSSGLGAHQEKRVTLGWDCQPHATAAFVELATSAAPGQEAGVHRAAGSPMLVRRDVGDLVPPNAADFSSEMSPP